MTEQQKIKLWQEYSENIKKATPVDLHEKSIDKRKRIARLEADPEAWFAYYFPNFAKYPPAPFHKAAAVRVISNPEFTEVRNWARESAKSTRTMMEVLYITLVGHLLPNGSRHHKRNVLLISNSLENAERLLMPYKTNFERNNRIINDYGEQENMGSWEATEFITKSGIAFRAIGAGQSPRGTRNEATRPDIILIDDIDTDQDCLNPDIIEKRWRWIEEALIPTRSISEPLLMIWCGNIIAEDCCVVRAAQRADHVDVVNIRDEHGKSTWPAKNKEADIDRVLSAISYESAQKEYFNNPMSSGRTFADITWGPCPPLHTLKVVVTYADPAPSNRDLPGAKSHQANSRKAVFTIGQKDGKFYIYYGFLDVMSNARFIDSLYACRDYIYHATVGQDAQPQAYYYIENNTLQNPFYEQVLIPLIFGRGEKNPLGVLGVIPDTREKPQKWFRIEGTLEPLSRLNALVFNVDEKENPHMQRLAAQFKAAKPTSKELDGPDAIEGGVFMLKDKHSMMSGTAKIRMTMRKRSGKYH